MKKIVGFIVLIGITFSIHSQTYFQKITTGVVATDSGSYSMAAWGDYNNDGYQDLVVAPWNDACWSCLSPLRLYNNNGNETFSRGQALITDNTINCNGVVWGDYDNNGMLDIYVTRYFNQTNYLFRNDSITFLQMFIGNITSDQNSSIGCSWADYDKDGNLDLFVANGLNQNNCLYHNNGNGTFTKITSGTIVNDGGDSRSSAWGDYDNDGWPDLFVVNYSNQLHFLYHNNGNGTFTKITNVLPATMPAYGSGCAWADYDNDGWLDLFVCINNGYNRLFHNDHNGTFSLTGLLPSQEFGWSYYPSWADIDNDGYLDLFVPKRSSSNNVLYKNINGTSFIKLTSDIVNQEGGFSDAGVFGDYNNDGKMDLFVANGSTGNPIKNYFYKNINNNGNKYITLKIKGCVVNKSAIGAKVKVVTGNSRQYREISGGSSHQSMLWQHFGLGNFTNIDSIIIKFTSGNTKVLTNVSTNQLLTITECPVGIINNQIPLKYELKQNYPNPFNPGTNIEYSVLKSGNVNLSIYNIEGKLVKTLIDEYQTFGTYRFDFNGTELASGTYFYKLTVNDYTAIKKMILLK